MPTKTPPRAPPPLQQGAFDFTRAAPDLASVPAEGPKVYQVSDVVGQAARLLEGRFSNIWVEGEIDSFKRHAASGHLYFALKDTTARIEAMMPRRSAERLRFPPRDGLKVRAHGKLSLFSAQGRFQMYVDEMEPSGEGALLRAFEELKARLGAEGLFARERKRRLPAFPRTVGVATSLSGAALHDILRVASRRGRVRFLIAPCAVQGEGAAAEIREAVELLQPHVDVIIVARGGGSTADLMAFNDEALARAIHASRVPVVSAVGHEVDFTICDFVADVRAPTPSAAAELVVPLFCALEEDLADLEARLLRAGQRLIDDARQRLDAELTRAAHLLSRRTSAERQRLGALVERLFSLHPRARLLSDRAALAALTSRLHAAGQGALAGRRRSFETQVGRLDAMSPLRVLERGYSLALDAKGHVISDAALVERGDPLRVRLARGALSCRVEEVFPAKEPG